MEVVRQNWKLFKTVGKALGVKPEALKKWRTRGVPHKYRLKVIRLAELPLDAFEEGKVERTK